MEDSKSPETERKIFCVTGRMAAGKNFVSSFFERKGFLSIDADKLVHKVIDLKTSEILEVFEPYAKDFNRTSSVPVVLKNPDGKLNRRELGRLLFCNPELLCKQEALIYPALAQETERILRENPEKNIILNATVLYKIPEMLNLCSKIIFVDAPFFTRLKRARKRDKMPFRQIIARFRTQKNLFDEYFKSGIPVLKVNNSGSGEKLFSQLEKILSR